MTAHPLKHLATRFAFFTGKGGVGKTSTACATAVALAGQGRQVLLVSTDPASNLGQVFGARFGRTPVPVPGVPGLDALDINPDQAAAAYREAVVAPYRGVLPDDAVASIEEQLSGACTVEVAAFDEFTDLVSGDLAAAYDHVLFDTAPTGHTLRLLSLPAAWSGYLETNPEGGSCLGPLSRLGAQRERYEGTVAALCDPVRTTLVLVTRPEQGAIEEGERTRRELAELGLRNQLLVVNGTFEASDRVDALAVQIEAEGRAAVAMMPDSLAGLPRVTVPLHAGNVMGPAALASFFDPTSLPEQEDELPAMPAGVNELNALMDHLVKQGRGLVMLMGKGGVGKTTLAAAIAVELAGRGLPVQLTTTDPAAHVAGMVGGAVQNLRVTRIDPKVETEAYRTRVVARSRDKMDAEALALLEEDLRSPCTEEVAVFHAFSRAIAEAGRGIVVMDTAPTGHTLLLLDATGSYHREMARQTRALVTATPMTRLQDPAWTRVVVVTLAETTPVLEATALQEDLRRAGIEPWAWVVNRSLLAARPTDPLLQARAREELHQVVKVRDELARQVAVVPWCAIPPVGQEGLRLLFKSTREAPCIPSA
jgi:arsenite-transporting ATPase